MDKDFFVQELEAHSGLMYRVAYTILHDDDACRDALQDAALKAWEKRHSLREKRFFRTWITRILINTCYDAQKKRRRIVSIEEIRELQSPPPDLTLALALARMPEKLRLPLVLCYSEGMTYQEAAEALHLPVATVRGRIHRAKGELRKELDDSPVSESDCRQSPNLARHAENQRGGPGKELDDSPVSESDCRQSPNLARRAENQRGGPGKELDAE